MVTDQARIVQVPTWKQYDWLRHGFSTRFGGVSKVYTRGDLNLGFTTEDDPEAVRENRRIVLEEMVGPGHAAHTPDYAMIAVRQIHGTTVKVVAPGERGLIAEDGRALLEADGLITSAPGILLAVQAADCVPVLVADTRQRIVAAFHAGWRGTAAAIVQSGVAQMHTDFDSLPADLIASVGPSIGPCCYSVGEEVRTTFAHNFPYAADLFENRNNSTYLNLQEANRRQLLEAGLNAASITILGECTGCTRHPDGRHKYFSHRMEQGFTGRAMGIIGVANP